MSKSGRDNLYSQPREAIADFVFDEAVARVFDDMIGRSVPGYKTILSMLPVLVREYVRGDSRCYDLGCSLGAATLAMRHCIDLPNVEILAVDNSPSMLKKCAEYLQADTATLPVKLVCDDIDNVMIESASFVVMNFTLQFIDKDRRAGLVKKIYQGLQPGGALLLSEKIRFDDPRQQEWMTDLHHAFKKANGYSELEISQKRSALENVLLPETEQAHYERLRQAGFDRVTSWFRCFNFASFLAVK